MNNLIEKSHNMDSEMIFNGDFDKINFISAN